MAVNINLNIYDESNNQLGRHQLFFGKALRGASWQGWIWVEDQGFKIDSPWAYERGNDITSYKVTKPQLTKWIENGFLSLDALGRDNSSSFLDDYPEDSILKINFIDWS